MDTLRYSKLIDAKLRTELVLKDGIIFNNRYEGTPTAGAVKIRKSGTATIADYDKENGIALTKGASSWIDVVINNDKAVNELIDGFDAATCPDNLIADRLDEATRGLEVTLDTMGATELATSGKADTDTVELTVETVYDKVVEARTALTKIGVPSNRRYIIVSPDTYATMLKCDKFIHASALGDAVIATGAVGRIAGFDVFESCHLGTKVEFVAGHPDYATRVKEWKVPVKVQDLAGSGKYIGACAVQGRMIYAHKVTEPKAFFVKKKA